MYTRDLIKTFQTKSFLQSFDTSLAELKQEKLNETGLNQAERGRSRLRNLMSELQHEINATSRKRSSSKGRKSTPPSINKKYYFPSIDSSPLVLGEQSHKAEPSHNRVGSCNIKVSPYSMVSKVSRTLQFRGDEEEQDIVPFARRRNIVDDSCEEREIIIKNV